jgi:hypothetical protein
MERSAVALVVERLVVGKRDGSRPGRNYSEVDYLYWNRQEKKHGMEVSSLEHE